MLGIQFNLKRFSPKASILYLQRRTHRGVGVGRFSLFRGQHSRLISFHFGSRESRSFYFPFSQSVAIATSRRFLGECPDCLPGCRRLFVGWIYSAADMKKKKGEDYDGYRVKQVFYFIYKLKKVLKNMYIYQWPRNMAHISVHGSSITMETYLIWKFYLLMIHDCLNWCTK